MRRTPHRAPRPATGAGRPGFTGLTGLTGLALLLGVVLLGGCAGSDTAKTTSTTGTVAAVATTTLPETPLDQGKQIYTYTPDVGDCFDKRKIAGTGGATKQQEIILKLDCILPHVNEVFAVVEMPLPDPKNRQFPGDEAVRKYAKAECPKKYKEYVGTPYELSKLEVGYLLPGSSNWPTYRSIGCYAYATGDRRVEGSIKGTGA